MRPLLAVIFSVFALFACSSSDYSVSEREYGGVPDAYRTYSEAVAFLNQIQSEYPSIARVDSIGKSSSGQDIWVLIISDNPNTIENEPRVRLTGSIHGNEYISGEVLFRFIEYLTSQYGNASADNHAAVSALIESRYISIIPIFNPDGHERGRRYNDNNVDLNRNFPFYDASTVRYGAYGAAAFDQSESSALRDYSKKLFHLSLTFHSGEVVVNLPFDYTRDKPLENDLLWSLGRLYAEEGFDKQRDIYTSSYTEDGVINGAYWYYAYGTLQDWSYKETGCIDLTVEVSKSSPMNDADIDEVFMYNRDSLLAYIEAAGQGISGVVTDSNGAVANVAVEIVDNSNDLVTDLVIYTDENGYYQRLCRPENDGEAYRLRFSKTGYAVTYEDVIVNQNANTTADIIMTAAP